MSITKAKVSLDKIIDKARIHLYKPIQIAEILYRDRINGDIDLEDLTTYRTKSKKWRDLICIEFLGRTSTSSARYQDDVFNDSATPPSVLNILGIENRTKHGIIEAYIYQKFSNRFSQMSSGLNYVYLNDRKTFNLEEFISLFWANPGLRRSVDKIYEIIVYSLFSALVDALEIAVEISINSEKMDILSEFDDFAKRVIQITPDQLSVKQKARINRVGVTNAADRGLDMWANFGLAIQIKHLSLTEELAENIVSSVSADRIVIVCKDTEQKVIISILNQLGWKSKIQSIITEKDLIDWYEKALRGKFGDVVGEKVLMNLKQEIQVEFPATDGDGLLDFMTGRGYVGLAEADKVWK